MIGPAFKSNPHHLRPLRTAVNIHRVFCIVCIGLCIVPLGLSIAAGATPATCEARVRSILGGHRKYWGVYVKSLRTGNDLVAINADKQKILASNKKILTTAAALDLLGPGYEFVTRVGRTGPVEDGVLHGDLVIIGGGDPNISGRNHGGDPMAVPEQWVDAITATGIEKVDGDIVADDTIFDRELFHPSWPYNQLIWWYCAPACGLSFNDNCVDLCVLPGDSVGSPARVSVEPATDYFEIRNSCKTCSAKSQHSIRLGRKPDERGIDVEGKCWIKADRNTSTITVDNPALMLATVIKEELKRNEVSVTGDAIVKTRRTAQSADRSARNTTETDPDGSAADSDQALKPDFTEICRHTSDLATSVVIANKRSQNFYAEQMHKLMGAVVADEGSFGGGNKALAYFLDKVGIERGSYTSADGSGMSRDDRFTARQMGKVLAYMADHPSSAIFVDSMAVAGEDGTLRSRWKSDILDGLIRAKTGYIRGVHTLSGYVTDSEARPVIVFSLLTNGPGNKKAQRQILELLVESSGVAP